MDLPIHTLDGAPADSRAVLDGIAADLGFVPNLAAAAAAAPALVTGFDGLRRAVASAKLDPVLREVAGLAVGVAVDNHYGVAFHSTVLGKLGFGESQIKLLRQGAAPASAAPKPPPLADPGPGYAAGDQAWGWRKASSSTCPAMLSIRPTRLAKAHSSTTSRTASADSPAAVAASSVEAVTPVVSPSLR